MKYNLLLSKLNKWAIDKQDIVGIAVVGSYARGEQSENSDIDICVITPSLYKYIEDTSCVSFFGNVKKLESEKWGVVDTVRIHLREGSELEFNFCDLSWADIPVDSGTYKVVNNGFNVVYDPLGMLLKLQKYVLS